MPTIDRNACKTMDSQDPLARLRDCFELPAGGLYFDSNSIGPMAKSVRARLDNLLSEGWRDARSRGWYQENWLEQPRLLGAHIAHLIGAQDDDVIFCDNTSVNLFKVLTSALALQPGRRFVLTERSNFPTDLYIAEGVCKLSAGRNEMRYLQKGQTPADALSEDIAVLYLSLVDFRTSYRHDMRALTEFAHRHGVLVLWDLAHGAGAIEIDLLGCDVDFAVGCGYKYLSAGPGAPGFIFVHPRHRERCQAAIPGWMGHRDIFAMQQDYEPAGGMRRFLTGTPSVIANTAAEAALEIWAQADARLVFDKHKALSELLVQLIEQELAGFEVHLQSPRDYSRRGGHVAFSLPEHECVTDALRRQNIVCSVRKPGIIRFGLGPLALRFVDIWDGVAALRNAL